MVGMRKMKKAFPKSFNEKKISEDSYLVSPGNRTPASCVTSEYSATELSSKNTWSRKPPKIAKKSRYRKFPQEIFVGTCCQGSKEYFGTLNSVVPRCTGKLSMPEFGALFLEKN